MALKLPPLSGLRLFEAAARCGSFKQAAHELNLTPGALSHGMDSLEDYLDVELFERKAHGMILTAAGRQFLPYVTEALALIATATLRLPSRRFEERLSISSLSLFAHKVLLPRLHKFQALYPNITVMVDVSTELVHLPSDEFDVTIRSGRDSWPKLSCDLLGRLAFVPVGAPGYLRDISPSGALDWSRATLIHTAAAVEDWVVWRDHSSTDTSSSRKLVVNSGQLAFEAAATGLGLVIGRLPIIDDDIAAGRLAIAVDHVVPATTGYWLVKSRGLETRREIMVFRNWLLKEMSQLQWSGQYGARDAAPPRPTLPAAVAAASRREPRVPPAKKPIRIGLLPFGSPSNAYDQSLLEAIRSGLRQAALIENRDIVLDVVWTHGGDANRAVADLIHRGAEVLVPTGTTASVAAMSQTSTIPIVFISVGNPIGLGLVENLAQPGGNATGFTDTLFDLTAKLVQLAKEVSQQDTIDYLWHTAWPDGRNRLEASEKSAQSAGGKLRPRGITETAGIDPAILAIKQDGATTVIVQPSPFTYRHRAQIIRTALQHGLPTLFGWPVAARDGALIAYGPDYIHMNRHAPFYIDQVLKGAKPADLPVDRPAKIDLLVNSETAKRLGLKMPRHFSFAPTELVT
jgi:DNA-binding transcriptional LysR family regulator/ABC-type uncharacterized transport system substrate-binding protein